MILTELSNKSAGGSDQPNEHRGHGLRHIEVYVKDVIIDVLNKCFKTE